MIRWSNALADMPSVSIPDYKLFDGCSIMWKLKLLLVWKQQKLTHVFAPIAPTKEAQILIQII